MVLVEQAIRLLLLQFKVLLVVMQQVHKLEAVAELLQ
tara:strand:- start:271 stop:381 length:111 start_codon:yes stop_codon:yes gene_type:complete